MIADGIFKAKATENWSLSETSKGNAYARVEFLLLDGPSKGARIGKDFYFTDKTWERSVESLRACGWKGDDISNLAGIDTNEIVLKVVHEIILDKNGVVVTDDAGNPRHRAAVAWVGENRAPKPLEQGKLSSFRELMKARLQQATAPAPGGVSAADDDLPDFMR